MKLLKYATSKSEYQNHLKHDVGVADVKLSEVGRVVGNRLEILSGLEFPAF